MKLIKENKVVSIIVICIALIVLTLLIVGKFDEVLTFLFAAFILVGTGILSIAIPLFLISSGIGLYCLPIIVGIYRKHSNLAPIVLVNLFLGVSVIGWIIALTWSFSDNTK
jgi:hypothetical protein